jgi:serine/threonine-protein kinase
MPESPAPSNTPDPRDQFPETVTRTPAVEPPGTLRLDGDATPPPRDTLHISDTTADSLPETLDLPGGRYHLVQELARGGMGAVYRGYDQALRRETAVKVLLARHLDQPDHVRRFHEEAWIAGQLQHPGVVPVYDVGRLGEGQPYFIMKLVDGRTLAELLDRRTNRGQNRPRFLKIFEQVCQTMAYAHSRGVIHRDLKPSNIMVGEFGEVQVMDWGLARVLDAGPESPAGPRSDRRLHRDPRKTLSWNGDAVGTPPYMAPEQARAETDLDERCDVFGLGAILCEILTGRPPFDGATATVSFHQAAKADLADAYQRLAACADDPELVALARDCLSADRAARPRDAGAVADRMTAYLAGVESRMRQAEQDRAAAQLRAAEERKRRRLTVALAAAVFGIVLAVGGGGLAVVVQQHRRDRERFAAAQAQRERGLAAEVRVRAAMGHAVTLRERASGAGDDALLMLIRALAAAHQAEGQLTDDVTDADLRGQVTALVADLTAQTHAAREAVRDRAMLARLERVRLEQTEVKDGKFDTDRADPAYERAFADYGIDVVALDPQTAGRQIRQRAIAVELAAALVDWAMSFRGEFVRLNPRPPRLLEAAQAADPDPWRTAFRDALRAGQPGALRALVDRPDAAGQPAATLLALATALLDFHDVDAALKVYRLAVTRYPADFWLNHELGMTIYRHRNPKDDEALRYVAAAVTLRPQSPGARLNLGLLLMQRGSWRLAAAEYQAAAGLKPDYAEAHHGHGAALARLGQYDAAASALARALELRPDFAEAHVELGLVHSHRNDWAAAARSWQRAVELNPRHNVAYFCLGNALRELHRVSEAVAAFDRAIQLNPGYAEAHCNLGHALCDLGRFSEGRDELQRGHELGSRQPGWPYPSVLWVKKAAEQAALDERLTAVQAGGPTDAAELLRLAQFADADRHQPATALGLYQRVFDLKPELRTGPPNPHRIRAVRTALRVGAGDSLDAGRRARWRLTALDWVQADLRFAQRLAAHSPPADLLDQLDRRLADPEWRPVRDLDRLVLLPAAEREAWAAFWADVESLRRRLGARD